MLHHLEHGALFWCTALYGVMQGRAVLCCSYVTIRERRMLWRALGCGSTSKTTAHCAAKLCNVNELGHLTFDQVGSEDGYATT